MVGKKKKRDPVSNAALAGLNYDMFQALTQIRYMLDNYEGPQAKKLILHLLKGLGI